MNTKFLPLNLPSAPVKLPGYRRVAETSHIFDVKSVNAVNAALASQRPLLVRGEPGTGKSQLARAAAAVLKRAFLPFTVDARTEARDLRYTVDTVARLAEAQILGYREDKKSLDASKELAEERFTEPGPLWWAFNWSGACRQVVDGLGEEPWTPEGWDSANGCVLLIDEIDKADPAVPNGLLEALGERRFTAPGKIEVAPAVDAPTPLVLITTNEERALPDAFVRRCLVLQLDWPKNEKKMIEALMDRGRAQFSELSKEVLFQAAEMVAKDRAVFVDRGVCPPGGAEYLDILRTLKNLPPEHTPENVLKSIGKFALRKHPIGVPQDDEDDLQ